MNNTKSTSIFRRVASVGVLSIALLGCILGIIGVYFGIRYADTGFSAMWGIHGLTPGMMGVVGMGTTGVCVHIAAFAMLCLRA